MSNNQLTDKINQIFVKYFDKDLEAINQTAAFKDISLDELDIIEAVMRIEDEFNIEISDSETESLQSIFDIITCVQNKLSQK